LDGRRYSQTGELHPIIMEDRRGNYRVGGELELGETTALCGVS
jgi:hypothetical protein